MKARAWSPSQATGFFQAFSNGSIGVGICLEKGVTTTVELNTKTRKNKTIVTINDKRVSKQNASTSFEVVERFERIVGSIIGAKVSHACEVPIGFGLNASGAGALSLSLALNEALNAGLGFEECVKIANESEIACRTGLGGVIAEATGGFCIRRKPGELHAAEKIPFKQELHAVFGFLSPIPTKKILADEKLLEKINEVGGEKMREFEREKTIEKFIECSRSFVFETGIASKKVSELLELFPECTMNLFGEAVCGITESPQELKSRLKKETGLVLVSKISREHAKAY